MAGFYLDSLMLHSMEASSLLDSDPENLNFLHAPVLVADITLKDPSITDPLIPNTLTLDGILGMNFLVGSLDIDLSTFNINGYQPGQFDWITFDEPNGILGLDIPSAVPEPSAIVLAGIGLAALAVGIRRRGRI